MQVAKMTIDPKFIEFTADVFGRYFSKYASCEFDKYRVDGHLCKLRDTLAARFYPF